MDSRCPSNLKGERFHGYDHPSFSSTLLDAIYRSFDESSHDIRPSSRSRSQSLVRGDDDEVFLEEMMFKKQISSRNGGSSTAAAMMMMKSSSASLDRRSRVGDAEERKSQERIVDRWRQNTATIDDDHIIRRRSLPPETTTEFVGLRSSVMSSDRRRSLGSFKVNSSPASSSDSSSGDLLSSSDADFFYGAKRKNALKPIRTSFSDHRSETFRPRAQLETSLPDEFSHRKNRNADPRPPKSDSGGKSAKSRALKLYGDLKRMKQPISPGGKLANFLNSLFSASGGSKKQRISSSPSSARAAGDLNDTGRWESKSNFTTNTTSSCSTASSYSRSCLSKRPSSSARYDCGVKRSVRFCPVSVIVDEDLKPCGHKSLRGSETLETTKSAMAGSGANDEELKHRMMEKGKRVEEMARDLLRNYHHRSKELAARKDQINGGVEKMEISRDQDMVVDDNDDDDVESCCSSDLFELEIGVDRYCEELPVYESTRVDTNRTGRSLSYDEFS